MTTWLVLGSSPSVKRWLYAPSEASTSGQFRWDHSITCNAGIQIYPAAEWCFILDATGVDKFGDDMKFAKTLKTKFVCDAPRAHTWERELDFPMDETIESIWCVAKRDEFGKKHKDRTYHADRFLNLGLTGPSMAQFALAKGATRMLMVGFEGYRSEMGAPVVDYFDGRLGGESGGDITRIRQAPFFRSMVERRPDVEFEFYGDLCYDLGEHPNLKVIA